MVKKSELTKEYYKTGELAKMIGKQTRTVQSYWKVYERKCDLEWENISNLS